MKTISELQQEIVDRSLQAFRAGLFSGTSGNMTTGYSLPWLLCTVMQYASCS